MEKHHWINSLHIIGLIIITGVLAIILGMFLPKKTTAPNTDSHITIPNTLENKPSPQPSEIIQFNDITNNNRVHPNQIITGTVPGTWFFEGSFPVFLKKPSGEIFATVTATTDEDWMVTKNVTFTVTLPDEFSYSGIGTITFTQDDPSDGESGRPIQQKTIPVIFENN
jgi:hypothetical protein